MSLVNAPSSRSLMAIDLLRFGSAMLVVASHYFTTFALNPDKVLRFVLPEGLDRANGFSFTASGWIGVEIFFVISGYVIAMSAQSATGGTFFKRRVERLLPVVLICAPITAAMLLSASVPASHVGPAFLRSISFYPIGDQIDGVYWTLGIEVNFYIVVGLVIAFTRSNHRLDAIALALGCLSAAYWLILQPSGILTDWGVGQRAVRLTLLAHGCFFALGMTLWRIAHRPQSTRWIVVALLVTMICFISIVDHAQERGKALGLDIGMVGGPVLFTLALVVILFAKQVQPWLAARMDGQMAVLLGLVTYPLYLIHQYAGATIISGLLMKGVAYPVAAGLAWAVAIGFSVLVVRVGEEPVRLAIRAIMDALTPRRGQARDNHPIPSP